MVSQGELSPRLCSHCHQSFSSTLSLSCTTLWYFGPPQQSPQQQHNFITNINITISTAKTNTKAAIKLSLKLQVYSEICPNRYLTTALKIFQMSVMFNAIIAAELHLKCFGHNKAIFPGIIVTRRATAKCRKRCVLHMNCTSLIVQTASYYLIKPTSILP